MSHNKTAYELRNEEDNEEIDKITHEVTDDPVEGFGVPAGELGKELDKIDIDADDTEDARERIEDLDEDPEQESLTT